MSENAAEMPEILPCVEIDPPGETSAAVVWLHGLGADGHDFEPIVPELGLGSDHGIRFVFPHAPSIPVTLNGGWVMPAWYDIRTLDLRDQDEEGIRRSDHQLQALIAREVERGIPTNRIVVAGFSQGGAIGLFTGLRYPERLAGLLALSTYLVLPEVVEREADEANRKTPILQAHGEHDPMVPFVLGQDSHEWLGRQGYNTQWLQYPMAHQVCLEEIQAIGRWLTQVLPREVE